MAELRPSPYLYRSMICCCIAIVCTACAQSDKDAFLTSGEVKMERVQRCVDYQKCDGLTLAELDIALGETDRRVSASRSHSTFMHQQHERRMGQRDSQGYIEPEDRDPLYQGMDQRGRRLPDGMTQNERMRNPEGTDYN